jgi:malonyl-CoA decarboxylase
MPQRATATANFLQDLLQSVAGQGRDLVARAFGQTLAGSVKDQNLDALVRRLLAGRGEASGVTLAREIMARFGRLEPAGKIAFLTDIAALYAPNPEAIRDAYRRFELEPGSASLRRLNEAVEPPRQEVIRRLNLAPGNTLALVRMRADLLDALPGHPDLADIDADFRHLFSSWFNRGFLVMRRIDWATPAHILEKIIRYEAVHAIDSWDELRRRLEPEDRRCFAFFHPALADEPLIFVEVALTREIPSAIQPILAADRKPIAAEEATTAVFYSISSCQKGLAKISFGNFLIKQVAEELKREFEGLDTFVTLSPVPGFRRWLEREAESLRLSPEHDGALSALLGTEAVDAADLARTGPALRQALTAYLLQAKAKGGQPRDAVQRFHLGNGAQLERLHLAADLSPKGIAESFGAMVNYLYDLPMVETLHERYAETSEVAAAPPLAKEFAPLLVRPKTP